MTVASCRRCKKRFHRRPEEEWKQLCLSCWLATRAPRNQPTAAPAIDPIRNELRDRLRALIGLCHPDKHNGSTLATATTQWLLSVRRQLDERVPR